MGKPPHHRSHASRQDRSRPQDAFSVSFIFFFLKMVENKGIKPLTPTCKAGMISISPIPHFNFLQIGEQPSSVNSGSTMPSTSIISFVTSYQCFFSMKIRGNRLTLNSPAESCRGLRSFSPISQGWHQGSGVMLARSLYGSHVPHITHWYISRISYFIFFL